MATIIEHIQAYSEEEQKAGQNHILKVQLFLKKNKKNPSKFNFTAKAHNKKEDVTVKVFCIGAVRKEPRARPCPSKAPTCENPKSFERKEPKLRMPKGLPAPGKRLPGRVPLGSTAALWSKSGQADNRTGQHCPRGDGFTGMKDARLRGSLCLLP